MVALSIPRSISQQKPEVGWGEHNGVTGRQWESHLSTGEPRRSRRAATSSGYVAQTYKSRRSQHSFAYAGLAYSYDLLLQPSIRLTFKLLLTLITCFA